ncbi:MAG: GspH/FimT family pseudopilin [Cyanobacteria bacterium P01_F01_bin.86]
MRFSQYLQRLKGYRTQKTSGFTLLEVLIVLVIIGILVSIVVPSWVRFLANRETAIARNELHQGIREAQAAAIAQRTSWRFSLRQHGDHWEWAIHPNTQDWSEVQSWQALDANITLSEPDTTLAKKQGVYYVNFGYLGEVKYRLGTVTVTSHNGLAQDRCVVISTLLGATRKGKEHLYPNGNGRYCY